MLFSWFSPWVNRVVIERTQSGDAPSGDLEQPFPDPPFMHRPRPHIAAQGASETRTGASPIALSHPQFKAMPPPIKVAAPTNSNRLRVSHPGQLPALSMSAAPAMLEGDMSVIREILSILVK
jgi:hypothetical protein